MVTIGNPKAYAEAEPETTSTDMVVSNFKVSEEDYQNLKQLFLQHCEENEGPWELNVRLLTRLLIILKIPIGKYLSDINPIWMRMVNELCPADLIVPSSFNVVERIKAVDDNPNTIFAIGKGPFLGNTVRILRLSNVAVAVLLRLSA